MFEYASAKEDGNGCKKKKKKEEKELKVHDNCFLYCEVHGLLKNNHPKNNKSSFCCIPFGMYVLVEHQGKLDLQKTLPLKITYHHTKC